MDRIRGQGLLPGQTNTDNTAQVNTDQNLTEVTDLGFAAIFKAFQLLVPLNTQYQYGIIVELNVTNPLEIGPFLSYEEALAAIRAILDEGAKI